VPRALDVSARRGDRRPTITGALAMTRSGAPLVPRVQSTASRRARARTLEHHVRRGELRGGSIVRRTTTFDVSRVHYCTSDTAPSTLQRFAIATDFSVARR